MWARFKSFITVFDSRFEDLTADNWKQTIYRDFSAGLITAMTAIPMAMGFAMAAGLRPEQGIIAGAVACLVGRTFGGSKYQVYGPTAAFIPVILAMMQQYNHGFVVFVSIISGIILMLMGLFGLGRMMSAIPSSIVVGFTIGIAVVIAISNGKDAIGLGNLAKLADGRQWFHFAISANQYINVYSCGLALLTFLLCRYLMKISNYIPAPMIAVGVCTVIASTVLKGSGILLVRDKFGGIPSNFFALTLPVLPPLSLKVLFDISYFVVAVVFVSSVESLLCSSMAERLANNRKTPFSPDKELWGQGLVQIITPLLNGFPCTGALARTATSIKAGARTPLAGYFKAVLKLGMVSFIASYLEMVPMACIGGILLWVATNMVKSKEIKEIMSTGRLQTALMVFTAVMVPATDFLTGVLSAMVLSAVLSRLCSRFFKMATSEGLEPPT